MSGRLPDSRPRGFNQTEARVAIGDQLAVMQDRGVIGVHGFVHVMRRLYHCRTASSTMAREISCCAAEHPMAEPTAHPLDAAHSTLIRPLVGIGGGEHDSPATSRGPGHLSDHRERKVNSRSHG